jgi:hypothetical protein
LRHWFAHDIVEAGNLPMFVLLVAMIFAFLFIRASTRMIRAKVRWWPGNVAPGGLHIHHVVFGLVFMLAAGLGLIALADTDALAANTALAALFGIGAALVLDEFAMVLHLRDVYWTEEGRTSIDAVFVAVAITGLFLMGMHPLGISLDFDLLGVRVTPGSVVAVVLAFGLQFLLALVVLLKGKVWTGLIGLFVPLLLIVGAIRVSRPSAPWARSRYVGHPQKMAKAVEREARYREPVIRQKIRFQEFLSGKMGPQPGAAAAPSPAPVDTPHR